MGGIFGCKLKRREAESKTTSKLILIFFSDCLIENFSFLGSAPTSLI
jgi:hypothetical protein